MIKAIGLFIFIFLSSCASVRQKDLDAWKGVKVEALDTHAFFVTVPMKKVITENGTEIRFYINSGSANNCFENTGAQFNSYSNTAQINTVSNCVSSTVTCNNIFKIKDGLVLSYEPTGRCYTDDTVTPAPEYRNPANY